MLHNYFFGGIRNILNNKFTSLINIFGLSLGISSILIIILFIRFEYSFDNFHPNQERIFRVIDQMENQDKAQKMGFCAASAGEDILAEIPGIENMVRVSRNRSGYFRLDDKFFKSDKVHFVDSSFFQVLGYKLLQGDLENILRNPDEVILTSDFAKKIFGTVNVVGKTLEYQSREYKIAGIVDNPPENSHIEFEALFTYKSLKYFDVYLGWDGGMRFETFLLLENANLKDEIEAKFVDFMEIHRNQKIRAYGWEETIFLQNIRDIHLKSDTEWDVTGNRSMSSVRIVSFLGLFILFIAILNYINLGTAQSFKRSKEIGLRKAVGAKRKDIMAQFLIESSLLSLLGGAIGIVLGWLLGLGVGMIAAASDFQLNPAITINAVLLATLFSAAVGLFFGIYPASRAAQLEPIEALRSD